MAFYGKEFVVDREENFDAFIKSLKLSPELTEKYINYKPKAKIEKDGDSYKASTISPENTKVIQFQSGVEFDDVLGNVPVKTKFIVDGNVITQIITKDDKSLTMKRIFSDNEFVVEITANFFDGVAYRYYKAV